MQFKNISIRTFSDSMKQKVYERQKGICVKCNKEFTISEMEADHITPWHEGGKNYRRQLPVVMQT